MRSILIVEFPHTTFLHPPVLEGRSLSVRPIPRLPQISLPYEEFSKNLSLLAEAPWCRLTFLPSLCSYSDTSPLRLIDGCENQFQCSRSSFLQKPVGFDKYKWMTGKLLASFLTLSSHVVLFGTILQQCLLLYCLPSLDCTQKVWKNGSNSP